MTNSFWFPSRVVMKASANARIRGGVPVRVWRVEIFCSAEFLQREKMFRARVSLHEDSSACWDAEHTGSRGVFFTTRQGGRAKNLWSGTNDPARSRTFGQTITFS